VRSGVLTSVHAFANDPLRGVFILAILVAFIGGGLALFAARAPLLKRGGLFAPISREGALILNNLLLTTSCLTVLVGTLYPLALEVATGAKISVGAPFFNLTFVPLFMLLMSAVPFGPLLAWKRGDLAGVTQRLTAAFVLAILGGVATLAAQGAAAGLASLGVGLALFVMTGAVVDLVERTGFLRLSPAAALARARGLPRSAWGTAVAHFGLALTLVGIVAVETWASERIVALKPSQSVALSGYEVTFEGTTDRSGPNYRERVATFTVREGGVVVGVMAPSKRSFRTREMTTSQTALMTRGLSQLYLALGDVERDGAVVVRLYDKPLVLLIWIGAAAMALGGALSLSDRRLRVGAPRPAVRPAIAAE